MEMQSEPVFGQSYVMDWTADRTINGRIISPFFVLLFVCADSYYTSVTNFIQGYIDNEINLNKGMSCSGTCADSKLTKNYDCYNGTLCAHTNFQKTKCSGDIFDCDVIDSDGTACLVVGRP